MTIKFYPKPNGEGYTAEEIKKGHNWLYADVNCDSCGKEHHISELGKPCHQCGRELK